MASPRITLIWCAVFACSLVLLFGCSANSGTASNTTPSAPTLTPLPRGGQLTIRLAQEIADDFRPWQPRSRGEEQLISLMYSGLMRLDDKLRPQTDLAERWETTPDGRTITFTLRTGLQWHDGKPLDSSDVRFTLESLRTIPFTSTALLSDLRVIAGVATPGPQTVVISLTERFAPLLSEMALPILPRHLLEGKDLRGYNFWQTPVGSGPFKFSERRPGQGLILDRFDQFHRGAPLLDRVVLAVAPDPMVVLEALKGGALSLAEVPWNITDKGTLTSELSRTLRLGFYPENGSYFLAFNLREGHPFAELPVRQALAHALNIPRLVEAVTKGQGIPVSVGAAPGSWADLTPPPAATSDLEAARAILNEAGWELPDGKTIRERDDEPLMMSIVVRGDDERRVAAAKRIAEAGAAIGMDIRIETADFATTVMSKYAPPYDFDALLGSWTHGVGDPDFADTIFYDPDDFALFHSSQINQGPTDTRITRNFVGYADSAYDNQAQAGRQLYGLDERIEAYRQTEARLVETLPYLFLWIDRVPVVLQRNISTSSGPVNLESPMYLWNIEKWYIGK